MGYDDQIILINASEIIAVVRRALSRIDARLVNHGERVAYIAKYILDESADRSRLDPSTLYLLCLLHDIGAYKTDEIDDMVCFETERPLDHSLYGYLFLKYTTHLNDAAQALLYHHTDYVSMERPESESARYAQIIHLADRADILMQNGEFSASLLRPLSGSRFHPRDVDALLLAEERHGLSAKITFGAYQREMGGMMEQLRIGRDEIMDYLKLLVYAIDFRSPYTVTHTADTTILSVETGKLFGLGPRELQALYIGAFLHDIGKIAIPHGILDKPGRLTPEEFRVVQRHIPEGENILRGVVSDEICDIAMRHHEKLDGSGYSRGLTARELTLPQRIVAVADIVGALSQPRPYKPAYPKEQVVGILEDMVGKGQLCPRVVGKVCQHYEGILQVIETSHDPVRALYGNLRREYEALHSF